MASDYEVQTRQQPRNYGEALAIIGVVAEWLYTKDPVAIIVNAKQMGLDLQACVEVLESVR